MGGRQNVYVANLNDILTQFGKIPIESRA